MIDDRMRGRPVDKARVATRLVEFSAVQERFAEAMYRQAASMCETPEETVALLVFALSEFINKVSKPELIPEAVETAERCLRINCGGSIDPAAPAERRGNPLMLDGHSVNCVCDACTRASERPCRCNLRREYECNPPNCEQT